MATTKTKSTTKSVTKPAAPAKPKVKLDDLNNDPAILDTLSDSQIIALAEDASDPDIPLAGGIRSELVRRSYAILAGKAEE